MQLVKITVGNLSYRAVESGFIWHMLGVTNVLTLAFLWMCAVYFLVRMRKVTTLPRVDTMRNVSREPQSHSPFA